MKQADMVLVQPAQVVQVQQPVDTNSAILSIISAAARDSSVDVAKMEGLLQLQERIMAKQAEMAFTQAMARLQPKLPRIEKKGRIKFGAGEKATNQPFAKYEDIDAVIRPLLQDEGFSVSFGTGLIDKGILISATLSHSAGHSRTESMPLPFDTSGSKNPVQAVGSTLSYGKRYLVCAMLNIVTVDEDDDANGISFIDERQVNSIIDLMAEADLTPERQSKFLEHLGIKSYAEIRRRDYAGAVTLLNLAIRQKRK